MLPLLRTRLPASALVLGSVAPDLPYYLPGRPTWVTHTAAAVVTTDVALGAGAWLLWVLVLARPARAAAPASLAGRLPVPTALRERVGSPGRALAVLLALAVGAATHVGWDEFTHAGRFGDRRVPLLAAQLGPLPGWQWAQYLSSVLGLAVLTGWTVRWWRRTAADESEGADPRPGRRAVWVTVLVAAVAGLVVGPVAAAGAPNLNRTVFTAVTSAGGAAAVTLGGAALLWHARRLRSARS